VEERPDPQQWRADEFLTLDEAAALFWPRGPLRTASLRHAWKKGQLAVAVIARKHLTTRSAIEAMARDNVRATVPSAPEASREPARPAAPLGTDLRAKITRRVTLK
jgi:hypothetical protein